MITLYSGGGSQSLDILGEALSPGDEEALLHTVHRALLSRKQTEAAGFMERFGFHLRAGTNDFGDEFGVLEAVVPLAVYEDLRRPENCRLARPPARIIAETINEFGSYVRFVVVEPRVRSPDQWDVFLCYASEDRVDVAERLYRHLTSVGVHCWYDQGLILWGDSVVAKISDGIEKSRYVIVVISESLLNKTWPTKEMHAALSIEIESGRNHVLPLLVGDDQEVRTMRAKLALQRDKRYLRWTGHPEPIAVEFLEVLRRDRDQ